MILTRFFIRFIQHFFLYYARMLIMLLGYKDWLLLIFVLPTILYQFLILLLISTLLPNLNFYLIVRGFHRKFAMGAACKQRTLTPPDTWSCPTFELACVLMLIPISPELVLFLFFWVSNIPRYFCFALEFIFTECYHNEIFWCSKRDNSFKQ